MTQIVIEAGHRSNMTATTKITGSGILMGIFVSQASSTPTIKVEDGDGVIANTLTPVAGQFYKLPCRFKNNLTVTISGTVDCTVFHAV